MSLAPGVRLGPYEIQSSLGAGGMGEVYRARDTRLERTVALKILNSQLTVSAESRARFEREAKTISQLQHPHICVLHDIGRDDGTDFLVMEFLEGESLADRLKRGLLPLQELLKIGMEIADALDKAHRAGVIHRDLKPGNVMLTKSGAKLLDFGLAKPASMAAASGSSAPLLSAAVTNTSPSPQLSPLTTQGAIVGTIQYMSPEQIEGKEADARSDIFAFGAMLYEMATGKRAFEGKSQISIASAILEKEPESISSVQPLTPPALEYVVRTCLEKDPEQRFQSARDAELQLKWIAQSGWQSRASLTTKSGPRWLQWTLAALLAVLALTATGIWLRPLPEARVLRATLPLPADYSIEDSDKSLTFSPDGTRLAMTLNHGTQTSLWVRDMSGVTAQPVPGTDGGTYPTWSPDSKSLALFADRRLKRVDLSSGIVQTISDADEGRGIAWGPDDAIVFAPGPYTGLFRVPASGGTPEQLTQTAAADQSHRLPIFLPDGKNVLYFARRVSEAHGYLNVLSLATRKSTQIAQTDSGAVYASPGFLFFLRDGTLVGQRFDASAQKLQGNAVPISEHVISSSARSTGGFAASNSGLLAYGENGTTGTYQYTWVDRDGKSLAKVGNPTPLALETADLSRDDRYLIIEEKGAAGIWLYDLLRGVATRQTFGSGYFYNPVWAPDGKHFVYGHSMAVGSSNVLTSFQVLEKSIDGNGATQELYRGDVELAPLSWAPDGKFVALAAANAGATKHSAIWMMPLTGDRKPVPFIADAGINFSTANARFSPDGHWFLYLSAESGPQQAYIVSFPGAQTKWQVSQDGAHLALWAGNSEIFLVDSKPKAFIVPIHAQGSNVEIGQAMAAMTTLNISNVSGGVFSHDGKRSLIALPVGDTRAQLDVIANWSALLKK